MSDDLLSNIRPGDMLVIERGADDFSAKVDRVTATQVICKGFRFRRSDGRIVGSKGFVYTRARPISQQDVTRLHVQDIQAKINRFTVTPDNVTRVSAWLTSEGQ
jgi:hypothetical protein